MAKTSPAGPEGRMTCALDPDGRVVDLRSAGAYERWRGTRALRCMACAAPVYVRLRGGLEWVCHTPSDDSDRCAAGGGGSESYRHVAVKSWVRDWLLDHGWDAHAELTLAGGERPDVSATRNQDRIAVEVQRSRQTRDHALERTARLQRDGYRVLWLTEDLLWVGDVPAVKLEVEYSPPTQGYRVTQIVDLYFSVSTGVWNPGPDGQLTKAGRPALETMVRDFADRQRLWLPIRTDRVEGKLRVVHGWATELGWLGHLRRQLQTESTARRANAEELRALRGKVIEAGDAVASERKLRVAVTEQLRTATESVADAETSAVAMADDVRRWRQRALSAEAELRDLVRTKALRLGRRQHLKAYLADHRNPNRDSSD